MPGQPGFWAHTQLPTSVWCEDTEWREKHRSDAMWRRLNRGRESGVDYFRVRGAARLPDVDLEIACESASGSAAYFGVSGGERREGLGCGPVLVVAGSAPGAWQSRSGSGAVIAWDENTAVFAGRLAGVDVFVNDSFPEDIAIVRSGPQVRVLYLKDLEKISEDN